MRKVVCACGRVTDAQHHKSHEQTDIHKRLMDKINRDRAD